VKNGDDEKGGEDIEIGEPLHARARRTESGNVRGGVRERSAARLILCSQS
jgi:hypothetical protein